MSIVPKNTHNKLISMGSGMFLLMFSLMVVVLDASNFLAFGLAFLVLMIGIMLVMMGAISESETKKKDESSTHTEVLREIVKVRCRYCNTLNLETTQRCSNCGAQL